MVQAWLLSVSVVFAVALSSSPALTFTPDEQHPVGSRLDKRLDGYMPLSSRLTLQEAKRILGKDGAETSCAIAGKPARCLTYLQIVGGLKLLAKHYFANGRNRVAIVFAAPIGPGGFWMPFKYCNAIPSQVLNGLTALHGQPDETHWPANYSFDPALPPEWPPDVPSGKYRIQAARFMFPRGGEIRLEYIELPGKSCMVRQIHYWGR